MMSFAVMQRSRELLSTEQLKAAFRGVPGLTAMDAFTLGKDALGVVAKGFSLERASALKAALAAQGVETEVVAEASLPPQPESRQVNRFDCTPDALLIWDPLNRSFPLKWEGIILIAAGRVTMSEIKQTRSVVEVLPTHLENRTRNTIIGSLLGMNDPPGCLPGTAKVVRYESKERQNDCWVLEIVIKGGRLSYGIVAEKSGPALFQALGERRTDDVSANFKLLVQDLLRSAPQAAVNRGAHDLRENREPPFVYPSRNAFNREMIWQLWQMASGRLP